MLPLLTLFRRKQRTVREAMRDEVEFVITRGKYYCINAFHQLSGFLLSSHQDGGVLLKERGDRCSQDQNAAFNFVAVS